MPFSFSSLLHFHFFHGLLHLNALTKQNPPLKIAFAQLTLSHSIANKVIEGSEFKNIDFRMLRSFRVLRPLKLVSRTPSKYLPLSACLPATFLYQNQTGGKNSYWVIRCAEFFHYRQQSCSSRAADVRCLCGNRLTRQTAVFQCVCVESWELASESEKGHFSLSINIALTLCWRSDDVLLRLLLLLLQSRWPLPRLVFKKSITVALLLLLLLLLQLTLLTCLSVSVCIWLCFRRLHARFPFPFPFLLINPATFSFSLFSLYTFYYFFSFLRTGN